MTTRTYKATDILVTIHTPGNKVSALLHEAYARALLAGRARPVSMCVAPAAKPATHCSPQVLLGHPLPRAPKLARPPVVWDVDKAELSEHAEHMRALEAQRLADRVALVRRLG